MDGHDADSHTVAAIAPSAPAIVEDFSYVANQLTFLSFICGQLPVFHPSRFALFAVFPSSISFPCLFPSALLLVLPFFPFVIIGPFDELHP
jgi:hypothetical protein